MDYVTSDGWLTHQNLGGQAGPWDMNIVLIPELGYAAGHKRHYLCSSPAMLAGTQAWVLYIAWRVDLFSVVLELWDLIFPQPKVGF